MADATDRLLKKIKKQSAPSTPIATNMHLPNHSGEHDAGIMRGAPTQDMDLVNKKYSDSLIGKIPVVAADPASAEEGYMILNSTTDTLKIRYQGEWKLLHTLVVIDSYLLLDPSGDFMLLETGDLIIL